MTRRGFMRLLAFVALIGWAWASEQDFQEQCATDRECAEREGYTDCAGPEDECRFDADRVRCMGNECEDNKTTVAEVRSHAS